MNRFLRENSQFIASFVITGYTGLSVMYKVNLGDLIREDYEFKNKKNSYYGISAKDKEFLNKFLLRLNDKDRNFEFFRTNTLDFVSFGFNKLRQGCHIGLPVSYFAQNKSQILVFSPPDGFKNFLNHSILIDDLDSEIATRLRESILLSEEAKLFGLAREIANTNYFFRSILDDIIEFTCLSAAYVYSFAKTRAHKLQLAQRKHVYIISGLFALGLIFSSKFYTKTIMDKTVDHAACKMGLDCCEGSIEYYDKMIERNKILRNILPNGTELIDPDGNIVKNAYKVPFLDYCFYLKNTGLKITDRRENCRKNLNLMIEQLTKENEEKKLKEAQEQIQKDEEKNDKELKIFKQIRLKLESLIHSK